MRMLKKEYLIFDPGSVNFTAVGGTVQIQVLSNAKSWKIE